MRPLVTAVDIADAAKRNEMTLTVTGDTIITPAARDAARDHGVAIVVSGASDRDSDALALKKTSIPGIDHDALVRLVQNVIESMGIARRDDHHLRKHTDPSGFCVVRAPDRISGSPLETGESEVISTRECRVMQAGMLYVGPRPYTREARSEFIGYVVEGSVLCSVNGRETTATCGDVIYLPAATRIVLSSDAKAKVFFVTCPATSRNTHH